MPNRMKTTLASLLGVGAGAALMYYLDPDRGHRRRALLRDQAVAGERRLRAALDRGIRDLNHRSLGVLAEARSVLSPPPPPSDAVLAGRVRALLGRIVSHPGAVDVVCDQGVVTLTGYALPHEMDHLVSAVERIHGVRQVKSLVRVPETAEHVSALQGGRRRDGLRSDLLQSDWTPSTRLMAVGAAGLLCLYALRRHTAAGAVSGLAGMALAGRALANMPLRRFVGLDPAQGIVVQKTVNIDAPIADLFQFWADPQNYPLVFSHVREVVKVGENRYRWTVAAPGGGSIGWEGQITGLVPNLLLSWRSLPGSLIANSGVARFDPNYDGSTRLHIRMDYVPPGGVLGHWFAELLGADPRHALTQDLARLKSLFERGKTRAHGRMVTREQVGPKLVKQPGSDPAGLMAST